MEIARWGERKFVVDPSVVRSFTGLTIKGSVETKDNTTDNQKYFSRKNGNPAEVGLTIVLYAALGVDCRTESIGFVTDAIAGKSDYMYLKNTKLLPCKLMLTNAEVTDTYISPSGQWISCTVKCQFKQCSKFDDPEKEKPEKTSTGKKLVAKIEEPIIVGNIDDIINEVAEKNGLTKKTTTFTFNNPKKVIEEAKTETKKTTGVFTFNNPKLTLASPENQTAR